MIRLPLFFIKFTLLFLLLLTHKIAAQVIISQYYEGEANNKFLEITNTSGALISTENSTFYICLYSNEAASNPQDVAPTLSTLLTTTMPPGSSLILKNGLATAPSYAVMLGVSALIGAFNGNDIIIISTSNDKDSWENRLDVIGNNSEWGVDKSLYRSAEIINGERSFSVSNWVEVSTPTVDAAAPSATSYLGHHVFNCIPPTVGSVDPSIQAISDVEVTLNWASGDGGSRLVIMSASNNSFYPVNGTSYTASANFGAGDAIGSGFVVYNGWGNQLQVNGLNPDTYYKVQIIEFSCAPSIYLNEEEIQFEFKTLPPIPKLAFDLPQEVTDFGLIKPGENSLPNPVKLSWQHTSTPINIMINAPFEISLDGIFWANQLMVQPENADSSQSFLVRFSPKVANGNVMEVLSASTSGAENAESQFSGTVFPTAWINEFHYDNVGADLNEFVEIVLQNASQYQLSGIKVQLINGETGTVYDEAHLQNFEAGEKAGSYTVFHKEFATIQNAGPGACDGIALIINDSLVQFLSYEGICMATEGPAKENKSIDVGLYESDLTPVGQSIQLVDQEIISSDVSSINSNATFSWTIAEDSPGEFNNNQVLPVELAYFIAKEAKNQALICWKTLAEINNAFFEIQRSDNGFDFEVIARVSGAGNSSNPIVYKYIDSQFQHTSFYRLRQVDHDGNASFSPISLLKKTKTKPKRFIVSPNPFSHKIEINSRANDHFIDLEAWVFSIQGEKLLETKGDLVKIKDEINQYLGKLPTGMYVLEIETDRQREKHKLLKK